MSGQRKCPACGATRIQEQQDKSNIISYAPLRYGKKYLCTKCKQEWRPGEEAKIQAEAAEKRRLEESKVKSS
ncbi:MAG: hypothetical protein ACTSRA_23125, partial [Promethearchaeota archaeon]